MNEDNITIVFRYPWTMVPLENADEWIDAVSTSLQKTDPLYQKQIFVSGRHEIENLILVENDTDDNYAIVSFQIRKKADSTKFKTIEIINSNKALAERLRIDHEIAAKQFNRK